MGDEELRELRWPSLCASSFAYQRLSKEYTNPKTVKGPMGIIKKTTAYYACLGSIEVTSPSFYTSNWTLQIETLEHQQLLTNTSGVRATQKHKIAKTNHR